MWAPGSQVAAGGRRGLGLADDDLQLLWILDLVIGLVGRG
jgi:hypothetical protein